MKKISSAAALVVVAMLTITGQAFAWSAKATHISCGQADFTLSKQAEPWQYTITEDGKVVGSGSFANPTQSTVTIGVRASDGLPHSITVSVSNAANAKDGQASITGLFVNCGPTPGTPGPKGDPGPAGPPGVGTPGLNGRDGVTTTKTIIERQAAKTCTSRRSYSFRLRKSVDGIAISSMAGSVKASEPGIKASVKRRDGRWVVSWSTAGKTYTRGGVLRTMNVDTVLTNGRKVRLVYEYRPCLAKDGNPNDPSASGQGNH